MSVRFASFRISLASDFDHRKGASNTEMTDSTYRFHVVNTTDWVLYSDTKQTDRWAILIATMLGCLLNAKSL